MKYVPPISDGIIVPVTALIARIAKSLAYDISSEKRNFQITNFKNLCKSKKIVISEIIDLNAYIEFHCYLEPKKILNDKFGNLWGVNIHVKPEMMVRRDKNMSKISNDFKITINSLSVFTYNPDNYYDGINFKVKYDKKRAKILTRLIENQEHKDYNLFVKNYFKLVKTAFEGSLHGFFFLLKMINDITYFTMEHLLELYAKTEMFETSEIYNDYLNKVLELNKANDILNKSDSKYLEIASKAETLENSVRQKDNYIEQLTLSLNNIQSYCICNPESETHLLLKTKYYKTYEHSPEFLDQYAEDFKNAELKRINDQIANDYAIIQELAKSCESSCDSAGAGPGLSANNSNADAGAGPGLSTNNSDSGAGPGLSANNVIDMTEIRENVVKKTRKAALDDLLIEQLKDYVINLDSEIFSINVDKIRETYNENNKTDIPANIFSKKITAIGIENGLTVEYKYIKLTEKGKESVRKAFININIKKFLNFKNMYKNDKN